MADKLKLPTQIIIVHKIKPNDTSYDTIWDADRNAPKKAYLELLAHPANITPYTPNAERPKIYNNPIFVSETTEYLSKGINTQPITLKAKANIGAMIYQTDGAPGLYVYLAGGWTKVE